MLNQANGSITNAVIAEHPGAKLSSSLCYRETVTCKVTPQHTSDSQSLGFAGWVHKPLGYILQHRCPYDHDVCSFTLNTNSNPRTGHLDYGSPRLLVHVRDRLAS